VKLKRGSGPQGNVVLPDGQPASNVSVLFATENENVSLDKEAVFNYYSGSIYTKEHSLVRTAANGRFNFPPKLSSGIILAASTNGFAMVTQEILKANPVLVLQPWAQVSGRLLKDGRPVTGETLDLRDNTEPTRMRGPWINFPSAITDAEGRFQFKRVPPTALRLTARAPIKDMPHAWSEVKQCDVKAMPGANADLGDLLKVDVSLRR
jgi:hypothetical protein